MRSTSAALISLLTLGWTPCRWVCKLLAAPMPNPAWQSTQCVVPFGNSLARYLHMHGCQSGRCSLTKQTAWQDGGQGRQLLQQAEVDAAACSVAAARAVLARLYGSLCKPDGVAVQ